MNITSALIVDDSKMARVTLKKHLESLDIKVFLADSGEESLDFLENNRPDVIFMDCLMPGIDGFETTRRITSNPKTASIPVIMCTGKETEEDKHKAMDAGAFSYMTKSSSSGPLKDILADLDKFDAQMSRITSTTDIDKVESAKLTSAQDGSEAYSTSSGNQLADRDTIVNQTLGAVEQILNERLNTIKQDFNALSEQFSQISTQLEDKIIFSVKSSIKESHQYTDSRTADIYSQLESLRLDLQGLKSQTENIDFDALIRESVNAQFEQIMEEHRSEMAQSLINETVLQNHLDERILKEVETTHDELVSLKQSLKQELDESLNTKLKQTLDLARPAEPEDKTASSSFVGIGALLISLVALALSAFQFFK